MPLTRRLLLTLLLAGLPCAASARLAVVAPFGGLGVPASEAGRVQRWLEAALSGVPGNRWLAPARLAKLLRSSPRYVGCENEPRCLGGLARQLGADWIVRGEVGSLGGGFMVYLRLVDGQGRSVRTVNGVLDPERAGLRDTARGLAFMLLAPEGYNGSLAVSVDVRDAWIYLDGKRVGRSPAPLVTGLSVGPHALRVTHEAYRDFVHFVNVDFRETAKVAVKLTAYPVRAEQMRLVEYTDRTLADRELPWYRRWWALGSFGAVVLAGTATTAAILFSRSSHHDAQLIIHP